MRWRRLSSNRRLAWCISAAAVSLAAALLLLYVHRAFADAIFMDGMQLLPTVDDYYSGHLTLSRLLMPYGEHRLLMYRLIMIANSVLFHLNMYVDPVVSVGASLTIIVLAGMAFRRSLTGILSPLGIALAALPVVALGASLTSEPTVFMSLQFHLSTVAILVIGLLIADRGQGDRQHEYAWLGAVVVVAAYFALLSGGYFPGLLAAFTAVILTHLLLERTAPSKKFLAVFTSALLCAAVYATTIVTSSAFATPLTEKISRLFVDMSTTLRFVLVGLAASLVDQHSYEDRLQAVSRDLIYLSLGALVLIFCVASLWFFAKSRMYKRTYLPIWMMFYSLGVILAVGIGRGDGGWRWMMNSWYSFHLKFVPISVFWILAFAAAQRSQSPLPSILPNNDGADTDHASKQMVDRQGDPKFLSMSNTLSLRRPENSVLALFATLVAATWFYSNYNQWRRAPFVKTWYQSRREAMIHADVQTDDIHKILLLSPDEASTGMTILSKYHLNVFATSAAQQQDPKELVGCDLSSRAMDRGWYEDGWIRNEAKLPFRAAAHGRVRVSAYLPQRVFHDVYHDEVSINLIVDGNVIVSRTLNAQTFGDGNIVLTGYTASNTTATLGIQLSKSFIPATQPGFNADERNVAIIISDLACD